MVGIYIQHIDTDTYIYAKGEHQDVGTTPSIGSQEARMCAQYVYISTVPEFFECNKERGRKISTCYE